MLDVPARPTLVEKIKSQNWERIDESSAYSRRVVGSESKFIICFEENPVENNFLRWEEVSIIGENLKQSVYYPNVYWKNRKVEEKTKIVQAK